MPYQGYYSRKKEEKKAQAEKESELERREKSLQSGAAVPSGKEMTKTDTAPEKEKQASRPDDDDGQNKSGFSRFMDSHVRAVTFVVCLVIFLTFAGPFSIFQIIRYNEEKERISKDPITMENVISLSEKGSKIVWKDFDAYQYENIKKSKKYLARSYWFADESHVVRVGGPISEDEPEYVKIVNVDTGLICDLLDDKDDFAGFLEEDMKAKETRKD